MSETADEGRLRVLPEKKRRREARIIEAAARLFAEHGYDGTAIEAIAREADVAVGTVYNYFGSKPALLKRVVDDGRPRSIAASQAIVDAPPDDPVEAMSTLLTIQMRGTIRHDKRLWRVIHATAAMEPEAFGHDYFLGKVPFADMIVRLLRKLQAEGRVRADADVEIAAKTVKYVASEVFRRYAADEPQTFEEAAAELQAMVRLVMRSIV